MGQIGETAVASLVHNPKCLSVLSDIRRGIQKGADSHGRDTSGEKMGLVSSQAPLSSLRSPASFPNSTPQSHSQAPLPSLRSPASFPNSTPQPHSQAPLSSLRSPASFPNSTPQPHSQAPLSSLRSPASFPNSTPQPHSQAPLPSLRSPASFPNSTPPSFYRIVFKQGLGPVRVYTLSVFTMVMNSTIFRAITCM